MTKEVKEKPKNQWWRPPRFKTTQELEKKFEEYKRALKDKDSPFFDDVPDVESFCEFVWAWRQLFQEYEAKPLFSTTIKKIKNYMYNQKKQLAMRNKINTAVYIFDAKNNHWYVEKTEVAQETTATIKLEQVQTMSDEDLLALTK